MNVGFPYQFNTRGRTAESDDDQHIREMIEQLLFTSPGERVNRPTFGSGLLQLVFAPTSPELAASMQLMIQGALQQWLGELIHVDAVDVRNADANVRSDEGKVIVTVRYFIRRTQQRKVAEFKQERP